jgi:hypothetical protein
MDVESTLALRTHAEMIEHIIGMKEEFASFMPRRIMPPNGYMHPRLWWLNSFDILFRPADLALGSRFSDDLRACVDKTTTSLRRLNAPTYFPSRELIDALDKTDVSDIDFADVRFPAESIMFMLPTEPPYMPYGIELMGKNITVAPIAVTLSRLDSFLCTDDGSQTTLRDRPVLEGTILDTQGDMGWMRIPCEGPWSDMMDKFSNLLYDKHGVPIDSAYDTLLRSDCKQTDWAFRMGIKLLIAMNTVGDIHAPAPRLVRAANPKRGKGELWQGQVMTLSRAIAREGAAGTHASPRFHLRRGHMRQQRHGERNSLVKTVWIKPTWVGTTGGRQPGGEHSHERTES